MSDRWAVAAKPMPLARRDFLAFSASLNTRGHGFLDPGGRSRRIAGNQAMEKNARVMIG